MNKLINHIFDKYKGRPIVVMGGAPSLPDDLAKLDVQDAIYLSANEHGAMLRGADYIVAVDRIHQRRNQDMGEVMREYNTPIISQRFYADYRITWWDELRYKGNSGLQAIWVAHMLGGHPVIVCGIEMYKGKTYWHDNDAESSGFKRTDDEMGEKIEELREMVGTDSVRVVSGRLLDYFKPYDKDEVLPEPQKTKHLQEYCKHAPVLVKWNRHAKLIAHYRIRKNEIMYLSEQEARKPLLLKQATRIEE